MLLLRHGQSYFNLHFSAHRVDPGIEDPALTPLGHEQAAAAASALASLPLTRIIASPYTRALETAEAVRRVHPVPLEVMHEVRERAAFACDVGSIPAVLAQRFPQHRFTHIPERWWSESVESVDATVARADAFRAAMAARADSASTLIVTHWAFILALTGRSLGNGEWLEYDPREPPPERIDWHP
jgi:broad specificity phosphatase PhoE